MCIHKYFLIPFNNIFSDPDEHSEYFFKGVNLSVRAFDKPDLPIY